MKKITISLIMVLLCSSSAYATNDDYTAFEDSVLRLAKSIYGDIIDYKPLPAFWQGSPSPKSVAPVPFSMARKFDIIPTNLTEETCPYDMYVKFGQNVGTVGASLQMVEADRIKITAQSDNTCLLIFFDEDNPDDFYKIIAIGGNTMGNARTFYLYPNDYDYHNYSLFILALRNIPYVKLDIVGEYQFEGGYDIGSFSGHLEGHGNKAPFICGLPMDSEYNVFTCNSTVDTKMFMYYDGHKLYNDNYMSVGDHNWGTESRIKIPFDEEKDTIKFSMYIWTGPTIYVPENLEWSIQTDSICGTTDVYIAKKLNLGTNSYSVQFPNYKQDDAIMTAPSTIMYNCGLWAIGRWFDTGGSAFPDNVLNPDASIYSWMNMWGYDPTTESDSEVDVWELDGIYTHLSIKSYSNGYSYGYAWESKDGQLARFMHPRYALQNNTYPGYGHVAYHFKKRANSPEMELVVENIEFTTEELALINKLQSTVSLSEKAVFEKKYERIMDYVHKYSIENLQVLTGNLEEYDDLVFLCKKHPQILALVYDKLAEGEPLAVRVLVDATKDNNKEAISKVRNFKSPRFVDESTQILYRSNISSGVLYAKELLNASHGQVLNDNRKINYSDDADAFKVTLDGNNVTIKYTLESTAKVSLEIIDITGLTVASQNVQSLEASEHLFTANINKAGLYTAILHVNGSVYSKKFTVK